VRAAVFVHEQGIPAGLEWNGADAQALHAVAYNRLGMAVGTGRLLGLEGGRGKMGRMAVRAPLRGGRIGRRLLDALVRAAQARGDREVVLHAQASAVAFSTSAPASCREARRSRKPGCRMWPWCVRSARAPSPRPGSAGPALSAPLPA
jgi:GNAT superfamily N-acetyltransferase